MIGRTTCGRIVLFAAAACGILFIRGSARGDLQVAGYEDRLHDPFYVGADKAFIAAAYNWSGYGRLADPSPSGTNWKQVTMISDNYFLTANHNRPILNDDPTGPRPKVRFYRTTDPNGEYWESEIAVAGGAYQGTQIGSTDLWVGKLASTPPDWVIRYPLAKRHEATNYLSYTDNNIFVFGQDSPRGFTSVRVGRNEIDQASASGTYQWTYDPVTGLGADEAETQPGDSGGPSFLLSGKTPVLAGVHTRIDYDTSVSTNLSQIVAAIGEPVSLSTGLVGDLNGDFRVDVLDLASLSSFYGARKNVRYRQGDIDGDGAAGFIDFVQLVQNFGRSAFAPADFDRDGDVDGDDLARIGDNWLNRVASPNASGDANGDGLVNFSDVEIFDRNQFRAYFGPLPSPLTPIAGDLTGDGLVSGLDRNIVLFNLYRSVAPGTNDDFDGNGYVDNRDEDYIAKRMGDSFGDLDGDHVVGPSDFSILAGHWNQFVAGGRLQGDLTGDGLVNSLDARALFDWWGQVDGVFPGMSVPEPSTAALALVTGLAAAACRRPRRLSRSRHIQIQLIAGFHLRQAVAAEFVD